MKNCLCCGAECASDAPHCLACGEASFDPAVAAAPVREAPPNVPDVPPENPTGEEPPAADGPEALQEPGDPIPGVAAAPAKRGPGRPKKDAPN